MEYVHKELCYQILDGVLEMGAQWIHGKTNNVVYGLASARHLTCDSTAFDRIIYTRSSGEIIEPEVTCRMLEICGNLLEPQPSEDALKSFRNCGEFYVHW